MFLFQLRKDIKILQSVDKSEKYFVSCNFCNIKVCIYIYNIKIIKRPPFLKFKEEGLCFYIIVKIYI